MSTYTRTTIVIDGNEVNVTNALMMTYAIDALKAVGAPVEIIAKAEQHYKTITKKSVAPNGPSAAAKENETLAREVLAILTNEPMLTSEIMAKVGGIRTSQKCAKVMQVLLDNGAVVRVPKVKGRYIGYKLA